VEDNTQTQRTIMPLPARGAAKQRFNAEKTVEALLEDANRGQQRLMETFAAAVVIAIHIGRALLSLKGLVRHGQFQQFVIEHFCKPNNLSVRTAERYCAIAKNAELLLDALRASNPELAERTDDDLLKGLSINKAYELIKQLVKIEEGELPSLLVDGPKPDPNGWLTPEFIIVLILELFKIIDLDPATVPDTNPLDAATTVTPPANGLASETPWNGKVWINPGLNKVNHSQWTERLLSEFRAGSVEEGLILLPACTNSKYASLLRDFPRAFTNKPLIVAGPTLPKLMLKVPLMIVYVGPDARFHDFVNVFSANESFDVFVRARS
jgi:hypothetical protein